MAVWVEAKAGSTTRPWLDSGPPLPDISSETKNWTNSFRPGTTPECWVYTYRNSGREMPDLPEATVFFEGVTP